MHKIHFETIDSTNTYAKQLAREMNGAETPVVLITAEEQTAGRGRVGKSFVSRKGCGLYMTVLFPVGRPPEECLSITAAAAVAVCGVLRRNGCAEAGIKWVNDIYVKGRKVCGILAEAVTDPGSGIMRYCAVGVGINLNTDPEKFPEELRNKVGSVNGLRLGREELAEEIAAGIVSQAERALGSRKGREEMMEHYRDWSMILGHPVFWEENGRRIRGIASDIDADAHLIADTEEGRRVLDSGFVSVLLQ